MPSSIIFRATDLEIGTTWDLGHHTVSREEIIAFARQWDPLPIHIDEDAARRGPFGDVIGSGVQSIAIHQRLAALHVYSRSAIKAGRRITSCHFAHPVRPGMTVRASLEVTDLRRRPQGDTVVTTRSTLHDERGELLMELIGESIWA